MVRALVRELDAPLGLALLLACLLVACQVPMRRTPPEPLRISRVVPEGDAARRASARLVVRGLDDEIAGHPDEGEASYERALQVDPTNPAAYLALARHEIEGGDPNRGLAMLDKAEALYGDDADADGVRAHLTGLRGEGLRAVGSPELAAPFLEEARKLAPTVWGDGHLDAKELR